jgi:hypothetical protein
VSCRAFPRLCVVESVEVAGFVWFAIPINSFCAHQKINLCFESKNIKKITLHIVWRNVELKVTSNLRDQFRILVFVERLFRQILLKDANTIQCGARL